MAPPLSEKELQDQKMRRKYRKIYDLNKIAKDIEKEGVIEKKNVDMGSSEDLYFLLHQLKQLLKMFQIAKTEQNQKTLKRCEALKQMYYLDTIKSQICEIELKFSEG